MGNLSSFLYILVADLLSRRLNRLKDEGNIPGISFVMGVQSINHVQFVDETILMGNASTQIMRRLKSSLDLFLKASSNEVYSDKS